MAPDPTLVRAEAAMRHGFACAGDGLGDEMVSTFAELSGDEHTIAFHLARRVIIEALNFAAPGGMTHEDFAQLGGNISRTMSWARLEPQEVQTFLDEVWNRRSITGDDDHAFSLTIVCGGYLTIGLAPGGDWPTFLDDMLDRIIRPGRTGLPSTSWRPSGLDNLYGTLTSNDSGVDGIAPGAVAAWWSRRQHGKD